MHDNAVSRFIINFLVIMFLLSALLNWTIVFSNIYKTGFPHGQKKSGKTLKKWQKSGENGGFWKKSGKSEEKTFKKHQILSVQLYQIPYI